MSGTVWWSVAVAVTERWPTLWPACQAATSQ